MREEIFRLSFFVALLLIAAFEFAPILRASLAESIRTFLAFYFLLVGLRFMVSSVGSVGAGDGVLLGGLSAALSLTFFWMMRRK